jgi:hypothetical protein
MIMLWVYLYELSQPFFFKVLVFNHKQPSRKDATRG